MGLFGRKTSKKELEEAKTAARNQPSPRTTAALIQKYIDLEELDDALSAAQYGMDVYPHSGSIRTAYRYLKKQKCASEMKQLQASLRTDAKASHYQRLAEIYLDLGDEDKALSSAETGIETYPNFEGNHLVMGKIRFQRWKEDYLPRDGLLAIKHMERALELNRENYKTLLALSQLYLRIGAKTEAEDKLNALLFLAPDDQRAREFLNAARTLPEPSGTLDEILGEYRDSRAMGNDGEGVPDEAGRTAQKVNKNPRVLHDKLNGLGEIPGFVGALVLDRNQEVLTSFFLKSSEEEIYGPNIGAIYLAAQNSSLHMDIGGFARGYLESPLGLVFLVVFEDLLFAIIGDRNAKVDRMESDIDKFLESTLYL